MSHFLHSGDNALLIDFAINSYLFHASVAAASARHPKSRSSRCLVFHFAVENCFVKAQVRHGTYKMQLPA